MLFADREAPHYPYVTTSCIGKYYFKMIPDQEISFDRDRGTGICYRVRRNEKDKVIWKTEGWYSFKTFLSDDGLYLIRIGNWSRGVEPSDEHLAVAFYKKGKLLKRYSTKDLLKDISAVKSSVSHYQWLSEVIGLEPYGTIFRLITIENIEYLFDISNGNIISSEKIK